MRLAACILWFALALLGVQEPTAWLLIRQVILSEHLL